ncbi:unknown [Parabacteroides johnsonii CAG:246]|nr:unknown [Parabacteroides johnsonii CAG:246]
MMSERMFYLTLGGWLMVKNDLFRLAGFFFCEGQSLE